MDDLRNTGPSIPRSTDEENAPVDTTSAEPLRKAKVEEPPRDNPDEELSDVSREEDPNYRGNPPRTSKGNFTAPKFGSAGSGGAEFEPGPERD